MEVAARRPARLPRQDGGLAGAGKRALGGRAQAADEKKIKEAGIQIVDLGPALRKLAYDAYWDALAKRAPEPIKELKAASDTLH